MKTNIILSLVLCFLCSLVMAQEISLSQDSRETGVRILEDNFASRSKSSVTLECHIQSLKPTDVETLSGTFTTLEIKGGQQAYKVGEPQLPVVSKLVEIPLGQSVSVEVLSSQETENELKAFNIRNPIYPGQRSVRKDEKDVPFAYNREAYKVSYGRDPLVELEDLGIMRSHRLVLVHFKPVQYSPVDSRIRIHNDIKAEIVVDDASMENTIEMKEKYSTPYLGWLEKRVLSASSLRSGFDVRETKRMLVIADPMFNGNAKLDEFVNWKQSLGLLVSLVFTDKIEGGATTTAIRNFIKKEYTTPSEGVPPTFLLLVGDHEQIPGNQKQAPSRGSSHYTDLDYTTMTDGDYLPDILCGRFSASSSEELAPQIDKTISYEKKEFTDKDFLKRFALVAGWDGSWAVKRGYPQIRYGTAQYFREPAYTQAIDQDGAADQNVFLTKRSGHTPEKIVELVSKGVCFFNYTAHGDETSFADPSFEISDIDSLQNKGQYPLVVGNCCLTASFQVRTCFGEKWLRAVDKGAIGYIGGSNYTYWNEDLWFGVGYCNLTADIDAGNAPEKADTGTGMYDAGFERLHKACNAGVMWAGNLAVSEASNTTLKEYYWQVYHLFGDPSLEPIWANTNQTPPPVYPSKIFDAVLPNPVDIPDNNTTGVESTLNLSETLTPVNVDVYLDIAHTYIGDLTVILTHKPTGKTFTVREKVGGGNDNILGWQGKTTAFNGIDTKGNWSLVVKDTASSDTGKLNGWKIKIYYKE